MQAIIFEIQPSVSSPRSFKKLYQKEIHSELARTPSETDPACWSLWKNQSEEESTFHLKEQYRGSLVMGLRQVYRHAS